jgi:hypothetical protein
MEAMQRQIDEYQTKLDKVNEGLTSISNSLVKIEQGDEEKTGVLRKLNLEVKTVKSTLAKRTEVPSGVVAKELEGLVKNLREAGTQVPWPSFTRGRKAATRSMGNRLSNANTNTSNNDDYSDSDEAVESGSDDDAKLLDLIHAHRKDTR